jgi:hypothetical protein
MSTKKIVILSFIALSLLAVIMSDTNPKLFFSFINLFCWFSIFYLVIIIEKNKQIN